MELWIRSQSKQESMFLTWAFVNEKVCVNKEKWVGGL